MSNGFQIKRSAIHGRGLFAARSFVPGEVVGVYEGEETSVDGRYVLWVTREDGSELGIKGRNALRFVNHSTTPNCEFSGDELAAIEPIQPGHELTCHYGPEWI
jgi:uncharacterized protein